MRSITTPLPPSTQSQILNRLCTISSTSTSIRIRPETHLLKSVMLHHCCHDPSKGPVTLLDHARGMKLRLNPPPVTPTPWVLSRPRHSPFTYRRIRRAQHPALSSIGRFGWRLEMDIVVGFWKKARQEMPSNQLCICIQSAENGVPNAIH